MRKKNEQRSGYQVSFSVVLFVRIVCVILARRYAVGTARNSAMLRLYCTSREGQIFPGCPAHNPDEVWVKFQEEYHGWLLVLA